MFNLKFVAANVGSEVRNGLATAYEFKEVECTANNTLVMPTDVVPVANTALVYVKSTKDKSEYDLSFEVASDNRTITTDPEAEGFHFVKDTTYCVMYAKNANGDKITISSQFIPDTLHAVLTVALYAGDSCDAGSATKAGEVTIDIPRFQLSGAMDITMSATGAAQTPLEGNALASGCAGCDGKAIYATITQFVENAHWYDGADGLIIEDLTGLKAGVTDKKVTVYAFYNDKAPRKLADKEWTLAKVSGDGTIDDTTKTFSAATDGTTVISATAKDGDTPIASLTTNKAVIVTAA